MGSHWEVDIPKPFKELIKEYSRRNIRTSIIIPSILAIKPFFWGGEKAVDKDKNVGKLKI